jgi:hypothetical protein
MDAMTPIRRKLALAVVLVAAFGAVWLGIIRPALAPPMIDGYPIGPPSACADDAAD